MELDIIEYMYHPCHHGDESSAEYASSQCPARSVPSANHQRANKTSSTILEIQRASNTKESYHDAARVVPRKPVPREVRADGQAGALPPLRNKLGEDNDPLTMRAINIPPPNLHHRLRQRATDNNPINNYINTARINPRNHPANNTASNKNWKGQSPLKKTMCTSREGSSAP